jgi:hypothetical protein
MIANGAGAVWLARCLAATTDEARARKMPETRRRGSNHGFRTESGEIWPWRKADGPT